MTWRYQAVWCEHEKDRAYTICEVNLDDAGRLEYWTESPEMSASGDSLEELQRDLGRMCQACRDWEPVAFERLRPGMTFKRRS